MIPIRDENPTRRPAVVTVLLIAVNVVVFLYELFQPESFQRQIVFSYGAVPALLTHDFLLLPALPAHWLTVFTSMFLHGGLGHLGGNMLYLWIFGNNIEEYLGHFRFLLFYLLCGVAAVFVQTITGPDSTVPMIGASGAISGVLGAYLLLYPRAKVVVLVFIIFFIRFIRISAAIVLVLWFVMQISGILGADNGIAFFAHIGGFIAGLILIFPAGGFRPPRRPYFA
jgi:membrane associated rhomboid family serine protease